ncbi:MAG: hypothetical protein V7K40_34020 [Nostoc sp.]|uniref:hypothetical protein n=1 Tax=Nostoc sp. TaxID=1180 RepID=UPI002FF7A6CA
MLNDDIVRYFNSKNEFFKYAEEKTENIGYVKKKQTWIRLPNQLIVLGENHNKTTLTDIVNAVHTQKFMYEGYTELPEETTTKIKTLIAERDQYLNKKMNLDKNDKYNHKAEDFYPKVLKGLYNIKFVQDLPQLKPPSDYLIKAAIITAASCDKTSELYKIYKQEREMFDSISNENLNDVLGKTDKEIWKIFKDFRNEFTKYAEVKIERTKKANPKDTSEFQSDKNYSKEEKDPERKADKERDFSMYQHIKKAKAEGYLLYGLGEFHRERLQNLLDKEGIQNQEMDEFLENQRKKYPDNNY